MPYSPLSRVVPVPDPPSMSILIIPQDIINHIIDAVRDRSTLKSCAATAFSFRAPSQKHLYSTLTIDLSPKPTNRRRMKKLHEIFTTNPLLGEHVRTLNLTLPQRLAVDAFGTLRMLPQLRRFQVVPVWTELMVGTIYWPLLSDELRSDLYHLMLAPKLEEVDLYLLDGFPVHLLARCAHLKQLALISVVSYDTTDSVIPLLGTKALKGELDALHLAPASIITPFVNASSHLSSFFNQPRLRTCTIDRIESDEEILACKKTLDFFAKSLEHLNLSIHRSARASLLRFLDLSSLNQLRFLQLDYKGPTPDFLKWTQIFLDSSLPTTIQLEIFTLGLAPTLDRESCAFIDRMLVEAPCLSKAHIDINFTNSLSLRGAVPQGILGLLEGMPRLMRRGGISIYTELRLELTRKRVCVEEVEIAVGQLRPYQSAS